MAKHRVSVIFGTRPEAIKLAPVILALGADRSLECRTCVTGQHRHMLTQVLSAFDIVPDSNLHLMTANQTLAGLTARAVASVDEYLKRERPQLVLVQGDTTTAFCAALAAFYNDVPVAHVEAGLRTWNLKAPWPEEANRVLLTRLAALHFAPTGQARDNLLQEGVPETSIVVTGNTVVDALLLVLAKVRKQPVRIPGLPDRIVKSRDRYPVVLITGHRRETFGPKMEGICLAIADLARRFPHVQFVYPVHLNPNVWRPVNRILGKVGTGNIRLLKPLSYFPFVALMDRASLIMTDSGGVQEEAPSLGKPVLVMRDATERTEALTQGTATLVGTDRNAIVGAASALLEGGRAYEAMTRVHNPFGDGRAAERVVRSCREFLCSRAPRRASSAGGGSSRQRRGRRTPRTSASASVPMSGRSR